MQRDAILHITSDEKFINGAYHLFESAFPGKNEFIVLRPPADPPIRYLSGDLVNEARLLTKSKEVITWLSSEVCNYPVIVLHGVNGANAAIFAMAPNKDRFMGIIHGAEIYNSGILELDLMGKQTQMIYESTQKRSAIEKFKDLLRTLKYYNHEYPEDPDIREVLYELTVFGSMPGTSYEKYIRQDIYNPEVRRVPFSYYPIDFIIKDKNLRAKGSNILLGNSASATNNHVEAFELLKNGLSEDQKIITPLSYGSAKYAKAIIDEGYKQFGEHFVPLNTFLPIDEYNRVISSCGFVVMNHYRPQAMGNIIAALYMGAKVFLNDTEIYRYFCDLGVKVFLIEEWLGIQEGVFRLLSEDQIQHNRAVLNQYLSTSNLVEGLRRSFETIFDFKMSSTQMEEVL